MAEVSCPQELPTAPTGKHYHLCADSCGDYRVCSQPDGCDNEQWICPTCEQERWDHHTELLAQKETTDGDSR